MGTLMGSCWKIFPPKSGEKDRLIWRPGDVSLSRKENAFLRNQKRDLLLGFSLSVSFHCKTSVRFVSSVAPENQTFIESEETDQIQVADQPKTAHVRFNLTKECAFGQHFVVVGDDPCLGLWDPSAGVRFDWSDGHIWTAELDVPCGKVIKYKFILKVDDNTISWQPGPDRILETWETEKTLIVFEDWDHPEFQDIVEEEFIADLNDEKSLINSELLTVSENLSQTTHDEGIDAKKQLVGTSEHSSLDDKVKQDSELLTVSENLSQTTQDEGTDAKKQLVGTNEHLSVEDKVKQDSELLTVSENLSQTTYDEGTDANKQLVGTNEHLSLDNKVKQDSELLTVSENLSQTTQVEEIDVKKQLDGTNEHSSLDDKVKQDSNTSINDSKHEESSVLEQEALVLLPGLIPMLPDETDEESPNEVKYKELKEEHNSASLRSTETSKVVMENENGFYGKEQLEISDADMQWGRRLVQKFLAILGF